MKFYKTLYRAEPKDYIKFKQWLKQNNLKLDDVAKPLNIYPSYLCAMFTGKKTMNSIIIEQLKQLGYDVLGD